MVRSLLQREVQCCNPMQVVEFVKSEDYVKFTRIIFDTAPTGHTLRLLTVPDFVENSLNKIIRLRKRLGSAGAALRGLFGASEQQDAAIAQLESLKVRIDRLHGSYVPFKIMNACNQDMSFQSERGGKANSKRT